MSNNNFIQTIETNNNSTLERNTINSNNKLNDENKTASEYPNVIFISPPKKQIKDSRNKSKQTSYVFEFSPSKQFIDNKIVSPQESIISSSSSDQMGLQCMICFRTYINTETKTTSECEHPFCFSCLNYYFQTQIINGNIQTVSELKCPIISCNKYYDIFSTNKFNVIHGCNQYSVVGVDV